jgi:Relaxase/Mobilisation nuclease domain
MIIKELGINKNKPKGKKAYTNKNAARLAIDYILDEANRNISEKSTSDLMHYATDKTLDSWYVNLPNDKDLAIKSMQATQAMNSRAGECRLYHYMFSFRESEKPSKEAIADMERQISDKLGYKEHQRTIAIHNDTNNYHVHVVINKVHPKTYQNVTPYYSQFKMDEMARKLEIQYDLIRDNHIDFNERKNKNHKAIDFEAHTGIESFTTYLQKELKNKALQVNNWNELHKIAKNMGVVVKLQGAGLVFKSIDSKITVKASSVDRLLAKSKLENKLGAFVEYTKNGTSENIKNDIQTIYVPKPLHQSFKRDALWLAYQEKEQIKQTALADILAKIKQDYTKDKQILKDNINAQRNNLKQIKMSASEKSLKNNVLTLEAKKAFDACYNSYFENRKKAYIMHSKQNWLSYLIDEAKQNNSVAIEILQSKERKLQLDKGMQNKIESLNLNNRHHCEGKGNISKNGDIFYKTNDDGCFKINAEGIFVIKPTEQACKQAIDYAKKSYGNDLNVKGSQQFLHTIAEYAKKQNVCVHHKNNELER